MPNRYIERLSELLERHGQRLISLSAHDPERRPEQRDRAHEPQDRAHEPHPKYHRRHRRVRGEYDDDVIDLDDRWGPEQPRVPISWLI